MANQEQLEILKQGVDVWNTWRKENPDIQVDLSDEHLGPTHSGGIFRADQGSILPPMLDLTAVDFSDVDFRRANLYRVNLSGANLSSADFAGADLSEVLLDGANLYKAYLIGAELKTVDLRRANLQETDIMLAHFNDANLTSANLKKARIGDTVFGYVDLSKTDGLEEVIHVTYSIVGTETIQRSKGKISIAFLRGCGLSDWEIESARLYNPELSNEEVNKILYKMYDLRANQAIQISPLFISYSHGDASFVDKLDNHLNNKGVRFWRDIHDATAGRLEKQIDRAIRQNPTVLLILSKNSLKSDWVEHEVRTARELEKEIGRDVLCPVALDDSWKNSPWSKRVMEQVMEYNILDFSAWKDDDKFGNIFNKLIDGLKLFYK